MARGAPTPGSAAAFEQIEAGARRVAKKRPKDWREGVTLYLDDLEDGKVGLLTRASADYDMAEICRQIKAIRSLKDIVAKTEVDAQPSRSILPEYTDNTDDRVTLAAIVTPPGWRESVGRLLEESVRLARESGISADLPKVRSSAFALMQEAQQLYFYLQSIESEGEIARAEQLEEYRRIA